MNSDMPGMAGGGSPNKPLNASAFDLNNETQAMDFLSQMLDDTFLQVDGNNYARNFWYGIVILIGLASVYNFFWRMQLVQRKRAAAASRPRPAASTNFLARLLTTLTALCRNVTYLQCTPVQTASWFQVPHFGTILLLLAYLGFILALEFVNNNLAGAQYYTSLGIRAAWLAIAQIPLLILLAGKNNLIGFVTGVSYDRVNILHRWVARGLLLLATLHVGYLNYGWNKYGVRQLEWDTDSCVPTGWGAYGVLLWLTLSTLAPLRKLSYEFFVLQHLLTFFGFIVAIMYHLPSTALYTRVYIWIPIGLYLFDRLFRTCRLVGNNARLSRATLESLPGDVTRVRVHNPRIKKWAPGSHVLLAIPRHGIGQSHPATIASTPGSHNGDLLFILKAQKGFTKRLLASNNSSTTSLASNEEKIAFKYSHVALIDGPYGGSQADLASFDTVLLISGSTGVTFTLAILLDLAHRVTKQKLPVRRIEFVWVVKSAKCTSWISDGLQSAFNRLQNAGVETRVRVFVTCDDSYTDSSPDAAVNIPSDCRCDSSCGRACSCTAHGNGEPPKYEALGMDSPNSAVVPSQRSDSGLQCAQINSGRPAVHDILSELLRQAEGETGVACCGPLGLNIAVRRSVAKSGHSEACENGTGGYGVYLHVEGFGW